MRKLMTRCVAVVLVCAAGAFALPVSVLNMHFDNDTAAGENYTAGGLVKDWSVNGNDGHLSDPPGVPAWTASGKFGGAFDFTGNGTDIGQSILVHDSASLNFVSGDFAIVLWVLTRANVDGDILRKGSTDNSSTWYKVEHSPSVSNNKLSLNFNTNGTDATINSTQAYNDNQWHFVVAQRRGSVAELWIDGVLDGTTAISGGIANTGNLAIGSKDTQDDDFFNGGLDEVQIFAGALSQSEIQQMMIPEPATVSLLALGAIGIARRFRSRKNPT